MSPIFGAVPKIRRRAEGSSTVLVGLASSAGIARGYAKLVLRPDVEPRRLRGANSRRPRDRSRLATRSMLNASGLVVERGSIVSHTAITGRMLGIPTVVAVPGATTAISDGDDIEIDGRSGTVRIFHRSDPLRKRGDAMRLPLDPQSGHFAATRIMSSCFAAQPTLDVELPDGTAAIAVTRQCDVRTVLSDNRFSRAQFQTRTLWASSGSPLALVTSDPPLHTVRRRAIQGWFTRRKR